MANPALSTSSVAVTQYPQNQAVTLPDGKLVVAFNTGTDTSAFGVAGLLIVSSTNWGTSNPTWTLVKQLDSGTDMHASLWWDAAGNRLHVAYGLGAGATGAITYISASYAAGVFTWDASTVTIAASGAGNPAICVDGTGAIFVAYRNLVSTTYSIQASVFSSGAWQTAYQLSHNVGSSSTFYVQLLRAGVATIAVTWEAGNIIGQVHPDTNAFNVWNATIVSTTAGGSPSIVYGPMAAFADSASSVWISTSATSTNTGLWVRQFTFDATGTPSWVGSWFQIESNTNTGAGNWTRANGILYLIYHRLTSANNSDLWYTTNNGVSWASSRNITQSAALNNISPIVPALFSGSTLPIVYETGTASPFTIAYTSIIVPSSPYSPNRTDYVGRGVDSTLVTTSALWYIGRGISSTLVARYIPRGLLGTLVTPPVANLNLGPSTYYVPRAIESTLILSTNDNVLSAVDASTFQVTASATDALSADDSATSYGDNALPIDALSASDSPSYADSATATDGLTASDSIANQDGATLTDALSTSDGITGQDGANLSELNTASDVGNGQQWNVDALTASDSPSFLDNTIPLDSIPAGDSLLRNDGYGATDALSADDSASSMVQSSAGGVTNNPMSSTDSLVIADVFSRMDLWNITDALSLLDVAAITSSPLLPVWITRDGKATWITRDGQVVWVTRDDKAQWASRDDKATWDTRDETVTWKTRR